jgi:hypothetical protein
MLPGYLEEFAPLVKCFPVGEEKWIHDVLILLPELESKVRGELEDLFRQAMRSLPPVAEAIQSCPSVLERHRMGGRERSAESLIEALCQSGELSSIEFLMPTGAILGRAFVLAKLNFLKALAYLLEGAGKHTEAAFGHIKECISDTIFSKLAEELLTGAISNPNNPFALKRAAAQKLLVMWNDRLRLPVGEFPPVLLSAWRARGKVRAIYGTLIGVNEVLSLIQGECESRFVNYFAREHVTSDESAAFREFLFGLSYEELEQLRGYMKEKNLQVISPEGVQGVFSNLSYVPVFSNPSPEQIYSSYYRRRLRAEYRAITGAPGPRKTAEGYIMESLLRDGA